MNTINQFCGKFTKLVVFVMLFGVLGTSKAFAYDFSAACSSGQTLYYNITDATNHYVALTYPGSSTSNPWGGYTKPTENLVLPSTVTYNGIEYAITAITQYAFYGCSDLKRVNIPLYVTTIGDRAFWDCYQLNQVNYNAVNCTSMKTSYNGVYYSVFSSDEEGSPTRLARVIVGNGVQYIPKYAFKDAVDVYQTLTIPASVQNIDDYAFYNTKVLELNILGNGLSRIGNYSFAYCKVLETHLNLPNSVTTVGNYAFYNCLRLQGVTFGEGIEVVGEYAFWNCPVLETVNFNAVNCTTMYTRTGTSSSNYQYWSVFNKSETVGDVTPIIDLSIGENVTRIPDYAFRNSTNITSNIIIPNATTYIGLYAFHGVRSAELTLGTGVEEIKGYAFWNCPNMQTVYFNPTNCTSMNTNSQYAVFNGSTSGSTTPIVTLNIGNNVTRIPDYAFRNSINLTHDIVIPNATTYIGLYSFYGVQSEELTIGEGVATIKDYAFWNCPNLATVHFNAVNCTSMVTNSQYAVFNSGISSGEPTPIVTLTIGNSVTRIPDYAFRGSSNMTCDVLLPASTTYLGIYSFAYSSGHNVFTGNGVTVIPHHAFYQSSGFVGTLQFGGALTTVEQNAFEECSGFTGSLVFPNTVTSLGDYSFHNCSGFNGTLTLSEALTTINQHTFDGCSGFIGSLVIPNATTLIEQYAFYSCSSIEELTIGEGMSEIKGYAFWNCPQMQTMHFNAVNCTSMVTNSQYAVFNSTTTTGDATPIVILTIGNSVTRIPDYAFRNSNSLTSHINIPNATTYVGLYSFYGAKSPELTIGEGVVTIKDYAFWNCPQMQTVHFNAVNCTTMVTNSQYAVFNSGTSNGGSTPIVTLTIGNNVTRIPEYAFIKSNNMTCDVMIPNSVTYLGSYSFAYCSGHNVFTGNGVTVIPHHAFYQSSGFVGTLQFGSALTTVEQNAFEECSGFTGSLVFPNTVTLLGDYSFHNCSGFNGTLTLSEALTTINQHTFDGCSGFIGLLVIPNATTLIEQYAFYGCSSIEELTIGEGMSEIKGYAFWNCPQMQTVHFNAVNCTSMVTDSQYAVFNSTTTTGDATPIVTLTIGEHVMRIPDYAFIKSSNMTCAVTIPDATTYIGTYSFHSCSQLPELTIGEGVVTIMDYAFWNCPLMQTVHFNAINCEQMYTRTGTSSSNYQYYSVFNGGTTNGGSSSIITLTIGDKVTRIPDFAFRNSSNMTCDIIIPDAVISLGQYSFAYCSGRNVFTGNNVTLITHHTFYQSAGFDGTLLLGDALTTIGQHAFDGCSGFVGDLVIPNSVTSLGEYSFQNCSGFDGSLVIGSGVYDILQYTFAYCTGFTKTLIIGRNVNSIGEYAFRDCSNFSYLISENPEPPSAVDNSFYNMNFTIPAYVPIRTIRYYREASGWSLFVNYVEQCVFEWYISMTDENWSNTENWYNQKYPSTNDVVCVNSDCLLDVDADVLHLYVYNINDALTIQSGKTLSTTYGIGALQPSQVVIADGGQLINPISNAYGTVKKHINGYNTGEGGWYTLASPIYGGLAVNSLTTGTYDLYQYDEPTHYWMNEKHENYTKLKVASGFLYANQTERTLSMAGQIVGSNAEISVPVTRTMHELPGLNLVGNPYTHNINIGEVKINGTALESYYKATGGGNIVAYTNDEPIKPGEGFFVTAMAGDTLTFTPISRSENNSGYVRLVLGSKDTSLVVYDRAYLYTDGGKTLKKLRINAGESLLYFKQNGENYAVATDPTRAVLCFEPTKAGNFTIEASVVNTNYSYLHLIDHLANKDIDLLSTPTYTFEAAKSDPVDRFDLLLLPNTIANRSKDSDSNDGFIMPFHNADVNQNAYYDGNPFIITVATDPVDIGTVTGGGTYDRGETATLTANTDTDYHFVNWTRNGVEMSTDEVFSFLVTDGGEYVAHFSCSKEIVATANPTEGGIVMGSGTYEIESVCTLRVMENPGYEFQCWANSDGYVVSTNPIYSFTVTEDIEYIAYFTTGSCNISYNLYDSYGDGWNGNCLVVTDENGNSESFTILSGRSATYSRDYSQGTHLTLTWIKGNYLNECSFSINYSDGTLVYSGSNLNGTSYGFDVDCGCPTMEYHAISAIPNIFEAGIVQGVGNYIDNATCRLTAIPNDGYQFKNWMLNGVEVSTDATLEFTVTESANYVANFDRIQSQALASGWSWWSSYIELNGIDGLEMLENSLGSSGVRIQGRNGFVDYFEYQGSNYWSGTLNGITNEQMYKIRTNASCNAMMTGDLALAANHPITINSGWNWIGFPVNKNVSIESALGGFTPEADDVIKGRNGYSIYVSYNNYNLWYGSLQTLEPGQGYMYKSNSSVAKTLTYQMGREGDVIANITPENNVFVPNDAEFANNMVVTAVIDIEGEELRSEDYELAAFVYDECRGSVKLMYVEPMDRYVAFLTVFGDNAENIQFVLTDGYDTRTSVDVLVYTSDAIIGTLTEPVIISFGTLGMNDNELASPHVYPNPSHDLFNVQCENIRKIEVLNIYGQIILSKEFESDSYQIDLSDRAAGAYMLRIYTNKGMVIKNIVKN